MTFKPEITLGQIVELFGLFVALVVAARKFGALENKIGLMYDWWVKTVVFRHDTATHERPKVERFVR